MKPEEFLEKHLDVIYESLGVFRGRMEDRAAEFALAATVPDAPEIFNETSEVFQKLADMASQAVRDLVVITKWDDDHRRVLRK